MTFQAGDIVTWMDDFDNQTQCFGKILYMGDVPVRPMPKGGYTCAWVKTSCGGASIDLSRLTKLVQA